MSKMVIDLMTQPVTTCRLWDTTNDAAHLMWSHDFGSVPVVDDTARLVGMLTDRDICMAAYTCGASLAAIPVAVAMSKIVISCRPDDEISAVQQLMRQWRIRRIPVVSEQGRLVGIVSLCDLAREATPDGRDSRFGVSNDAVLVTLDSITAAAWDTDEETEAWEGEGGAPTTVFVRAPDEASIDPRSTR
jgi:CBS domain-containing protein